MGQFSPDGAWFWDGAAWRPAISPDGNWRWDGSTWQSTAAPARPAWARPYASPARRSWLVQLAFASLGVGYLVELAADLLGLAGLKGSGDQVGLGDNVQLIAGILLVASYITTVVLFCMWIHRAYRNLAALGAGRLQHSPAWAVGWWFIPIANLWKPYQVVREIWQTLDPERLGWDLLKAWWAIWLLSNYLDNLVTRLGLQGLNADAMDIVSTILNMAAAALAVLVVRRITLWEVRRAAGAV